MSNLSKPFIDVSHTVENGMITYKGLPAPLICDFLSREASREHYAPGTEFQIGQIEMVANTGTYVDAPFHRHANGKDLSELPLSSLANLDGLSGATSIYEELRVNDNEALPDCEVCEVLVQLGAAPGTLYVEGNQTDDCTPVPAGCP